MKDIVTFHRRTFKPSSISDDLIDMIPSELLELTYDQMSGGQKQRVNLYFALAHNPNLAIVDEPESALDDKMISEFIRTCSRLRNRIK